MTSSDNPDFFEGTEMPTAGWWAALWADPAAVLAATMLRPGMDVVDLCCGDGWFTLPIAKVSQHVVALDIERALLDAARQRLREGGASNCEFVEGDAYSLATLVDRPLDFVFMANALHGVPDRPRLSRAVEATLKPGGLFAVVNWHQQPREETILLGEPRGPKTELRLSPEQTQEAVEQSGLRLIRLVDIPPTTTVPFFSGSRPESLQCPSSITKTLWPPPCSSRLHCSARRGGKRGSRQSTCLPSASSIRMAI